VNPGGNAVAVVKHSIMCTLQCSYMDQCDAVYAIQEDSGNFLCQPYVSDCDYNLNMDQINGSGILCKS